MSNINYSCFLKIGQWPDPAGGCNHSQTLILTWQSPPYSTPLRKAGWAARIRCGKGFCTTRVIDAYGCNRHHGTKDKWEHQDVFVFVKNLSSDLHPNQIYKYLAITKNMGSSTTGGSGSPKTGWFMSWKIPTKSGWLKGNPMCGADGAKIYPVPGKPLVLSEGRVETHWNPSST